MFLFLELCVLMQECMGIKRGEVREKNLINFIVGVTMQTFKFCGKAVA